MTYTMEALEEADKAHQAASAAFETSYENLLGVQRTERNKGEERLSKYKAAFAGGIVIESVVNPEALEYFAGYKESWSGLFHQNDDDPVWLNPDASHANVLSGQLAFDVKPSFGRVFHSIKDAREPVGVMAVEFKVRGCNQNEDEDESIERGGLLQETTKYSGELSAIQWRLPTPEEVESFGSQQKQAA